MFRFKTDLLDKVNESYFTKNWFCKNCEHFFDWVDMPPFKKNETLLVCPHCNGQNLMYSKELIAAKLAGKPLKPIIKKLDKKFKKLKEKEKEKEYLEEQKKKQK